MSRVLRGTRMWWELGSAGGVRFGPTLPVGLWSLRHELGGARGPVHPLGNEDSRGM